MVNQRGDNVINFILVFLVLAAVLISLYVLSLAYKSISALVSYEEPFCLENKINLVEGCKDSDLGIFSCEKGKVENQEKNYEDYCMDSLRLKEFYCGGEGVDYQIIDCPYGCSNSICKIQ
ncbi:TPA: hypothetical protein ENS27_09380 [bacterium]|nr:hypothetical protein [bacterium]